MRDFLKIAKNLIDSMKRKKSERKVKDVANTVKRIAKKMNSKQLQGVLSNINPAGSKMKRRLKRRAEGKCGALKIYC
jgi:orotidine-5'-phosphate decarboxylase